MGQISLLIFLPLLGALLTAFSGKQAKWVALFSAAASTALSMVFWASFKTNAQVQFEVNTDWIPQLGVHFHLGIDGISMVLVLLTNILIPFITLSAFKGNQKPASFFALILFMQSGLLVVFTALDGFLFYIGWEAALIPIYFICSIWGDEANKVRVNMKFFIYTIAGSLLMLMGLIYLYLQNPENNFELSAFYQLSLDTSTQSWLFWLLFAAFAIKMPIFPFHTWQPDTYTTAPTQGTMLLAGIMLKMGIYGVIRWLILVVPQGFMVWQCLVMALAVFGIVYASVIAFQQKNIKKLVAYSSIAHVGLIAAGLFAFNVQALQGAMIQMVNHGINAVGLFMVLAIINDRLDTYQLEDLGGLAVKAPKLALTFLIIVFGTIALPLTNGFIGEFLLLMGVYQYHIWVATIAGLTIILGAVYMLRMYQAVMYGTLAQRNEKITDIEGTEQWVLYGICALIVVIGVYPKPILNISEAAVQQLIEQVSHKF